MGVVERLAVEPVTSTAWHVLSRAAASEPDDLCPQPGPVVTDLPTLVGAHGERSYREFLRGQAPTPAGAH